MTEPPAAPAGPPATATGSSATGVIKLLNWADYLSAEMLRGFEAKTGIRVAETYVERNDDFVARVRAGEGYDVILPTDWAAEALLNAGLLQPLDFGLLPNWEHVTQPSFRSPPYDPGTSGAKYTSVCYFGTEGFAMLIDKAPAARNSWQTLYDPTYRGQIAMLDGSREVLGPALFLLAGDPNTTDQQLLDAAVSMAVAQKSLVAVYDTQSISQHIVDGTALVQCWDGDVAAAVSRGVAGVRFVLPDEGFRVWADAPCIPASAEHPVAAHRFLDHLLDPAVAARNADLTGYQPVVPAAEPLMRGLVRRSLRPTEEQLARGTFLRDLGPFNEAFERAYARVRAA
jgi:spermidine/putrescine transport system substrate-binding protein